MEGDLGYVKKWTRFVRPVTVQTIISAFHNQANVSAVTKPQSTFLSLSHITAKTRCGVGGGVLYRMGPRFALKYAQCSARQLKEIE